MLHDLWPIGDHLNRTQTSHRADLKSSAIIFSMSDPGDKWPLDNFSFIN